MISEAEIVVAATQRLRCWNCGKPVSSPIVAIGELIVRAWIECPECLETREPEVKRG